MDEEIRNIKQLCDLLVDPAFLSIENNLKSSGFLSILGTTHLERWHSAFLAWLLNPQGSHKLGDFPFRQLLIAMSLDDGDDIQKRARIHLPPLEYIVEAKLIRCRVWPDSQSTEQQSELTVHLSNTRNNKLSFDVCIAAEMEMNNEHSRLLFICENKVKAKESKDQTIKYAEYVLEDKHKDSRDGRLFDEPECSLADKLYRALLFLSPDAEGKESQGRRAMSPDFITFSYQQLVDELLKPCAMHPSLSSQGSEIIQEFLRNLASSPSDAGFGRIAISPAESKWVEEIMRKEEHYKKQYKISPLNLLTQIRVDGEDAPKSSVEAHGTSLVSIIDLIDAKLLRVGDRLIYKRGDVEKEAEVVDGGIKVNDHVFEALSSAAKEILGGRVCRGWDRFKVNTPDSDSYNRTLLELREKFRSTTADSALANPSTAPDGKFIALAKAVLKAHRETFKVIEEVIQAEHIEDFEIGRASCRGRVVTLSELVEL